MYTRPGPAYSASNAHRAGASSSRYEPYARRTSTYRYEPLPSQLPPAPASASASASTSASAPAPPSDAESTKAIDPLEEYRTQRHYSAILKEIATFIEDLIRFSPDSIYWKDFVGAEWDRDMFKPLIINYMRTIIARENDLGIKCYVDDETRAHRHWHTAHAVMQMRHYAEKGLPVLCDVMTRNELILMGSRIPYVHDHLWDPRKYK
ncbi:unnamed protein product [Peniophora sp. CBMAI 1063]|nr:unnamed protein product [Peniophora sp. CBMAI 1063]